MNPDQVISIIRNSTRFKTDLDRIIQAAVRKGQIELLDVIIHSERSTELTYLNKVRKTLVHQHDHGATDEHS